MLLSDKNILASSERICAECGKKFSVHAMDQWIYKLNVKGKMAWFCRYNCFRVAEKEHIIQMKANRKSTGRNNELKSKKPSKEVIESNLRAGLAIGVIAKKHDSSVQSVHNWIKSYGLAGIQGQKKPVDKPVVAPKVDEKPILEEMVQESPTLKDIEQFHTDELVQELPKVEFDPPTPFVEEQDEDDLRYKALDKEQEEMDALVTGQQNEVNAAIAKHNKRVAPIVGEPESQIESTLDQIWQGVTDRLALAKRKYAEQADKEFRDHLITLVLAVTNGRGI